MFANKILIAAGTVSVNKTLGIIISSDPNVWGLPMHGVSHGTRCSSSIVVVLPRHGVYQGEIPAIESV